MLYLCRMFSNAIERKSKMWNLWHGCHRLSAGCKHCYVYRGDSKRRIDSNIISKTKNFDLPVQKKRNGESGYYARPCDFDWVMELYRLCVEQNVSFWFKQTGAKFIKDGKLYEINRRLQHAQACKAGINFVKTICE